MSDKKGFELNAIPSSVDVKAIQDTAFPVEAFESSGPSAATPLITVKSAWNFAIEEDLTVTGTLISKNICPIGAIIPWHKSLTGVPTLPAGFLECDGSAISDSASPMNGQNVPDINGNGYFIRGAATSGTTQTDQFQHHYHSVGGFVPYANGGAVFSFIIAPSSAGLTAMTVTNPTTGTGGAPRTGSETRPVNIAMVFIIRIK